MTAVFSPLQTALFTKIKQAPAQRLTFAEYMDWILYNPDYGYYSQGNVKIGQKGDFFTSVSLGADFGQLLAEQFREMWLNLNKPIPFDLVEMGAGTGELANDILSYLQAKDQDLWKALNYQIIEKSPALQIKQRQHLQKFTNKILWQDWSEIAENSLTGCCFSNELIDAFPVHLITINNQSLQEIYVAQESGKLCEVVGEISAIALQDYFSLININFTETSYPSTYRTEVNLDALDWLATVTSKIKQGYLLTIDYGYSAEKYYHPQRCQGTLQCYFQHHCGDDPYQNLGQQDITTHVNFTALENQGKLLGLELLGFTQQGLFLMALGLGDRLTELSTGKYSLPEIFQRRDALHQLINPTGLGKFGVLIQSKGLSSAQNQKKLRGLSHLFDN